jgi:hypothetical protein
MYFHILLTNIPRNLRYDNIREMGQVRFAFAFLCSYKFSLMYIFIFFISSKIIEFIVILWSSVYIIILFNHIFMFFFGLNTFINRMPSTLLATCYRDHTF